MIVAFSTSSPQASVALIEDDGRLIGSGEAQAPMAASGACLRLLEELLAAHKRVLSEANLFLSDLGPGSFTGVKVGVTLAKTFALAEKGMAGGAQSFDLIDPDGVVVLPSKKGEWFVRKPGEEPIRTNELPSQSFKGYGSGIQDSCYPHATKFALLLNRIKSGEPELLVPEYLIEPAISTPKIPYRQVNS